MTFPTFGPPSRVSRCACVGSPSSSSPSPRRTLGCVRTQRITVNEHRYSSEAPVSPSDWLLCPPAKALVVSECTIVFLPKTLSQAHFLFFLPGIQSHPSASPRFCWWGAL